MEIGSRHNKNLKQSHPKRLKRGNNVLKRCDEKEAVMLKVTSVSNRYLNNMIYDKQTNKQTITHKIYKTHGYLLSSLSLT